MGSSLGAHSLPNQSLLIPNITGVCIPVLLFVVTSPITLTIVAITPTRYSGCYHITSERMSPTGGKLRTISSTSDSLSDYGLLY